MKRITLSCLVASLLMMSGQSFAYTENLASVTIHPDGSYNAIGGATALGARTLADGVISTAVGAEARAHDLSSTAIGAASESTQEGSTAIGVMANADGKFATAVGFQSNAIGEKAIAIGGNAKATARNTVAIGARAESTAEFATSLGQWAIASGAYSVALGGADTLASGVGASVFGINSKAEGDYATAGGVAARATGNNSSAYGRKSISTTEYASAYGAFSTASGNQATAMGSGATATGNNTAVLGADGIASGNESTALGVESKATLEGSIALGYRSQTEGSLTTQTGGTTAINDATVNDITYGTFAGSTPASVVSVGNENSARRIQYVGAGLISETSTDAINGSQLYAVLNDGGWKTNVAGTSNIAAGANTTESTIHFGNAVNFAAANNMEINRNVDNDGNVTYTYGTKPDVQFNKVTVGNKVVISGDSVSMGNNRIENVAPGEKDTDAVNMSQLRNSINNVTNPLRQEIKDVGASAAALSALKTIQYDPLEPTQIMVGYGNYRGSSALAMGVAHYKNESTMFHAGMAWSSGINHLMANAGITWKVGSRDSETAVADRYRKGPISSAYALQNEMSAIKAQNDKLKHEVVDLRNENEMIKSENEAMKAQIAMIMSKLGLQ